MANVINPTIFVYPAQHVLNLVLETEIGHDICRRKEAGKLREWCFDLHDIEKTNFLKFILSLYRQVLAFGRMHLSFSGNERLSLRVLLLFQSLHIESDYSNKKAPPAPIAPSKMDNNKLIIIF